MCDSFLSWFLFCMITFNHRNVRYIALFICPRFQQVLLTIMSCLVCTWCVIHIPPILFCEILYAGSMEVCLAGRCGIKRLVALVSFANVMFFGYLVCRFYGVRHFWYVCHMGTGGTCILFQRYVLGYICNLL